MTDEPEGPSHAERSRTLVQMRGEGALATIAREPAGHPYASHVLYALVGDAPVFLISRLAEHTRNLEADGRASLLVAEGGEQSLARSRVTLVGRCERVGDRLRVEPAFLARHPSASAYVGFGDFAFWELKVESARYIEGFGRMSWVDGESWARAEPDPLAEHADAIVAHMNDDHADACLAYARAFGGVPDATASRMTGVDRYGFELSVETPGGPREVRLGFDAPVDTPTAVRRALVAMVRNARTELGSG